MLKRFDHRSAFVVVVGASLSMLACDLIKKDKTDEAGAPVTPVATAAVDAAAAVAPTPTETATAVAPLGGGSSSSSSGGVAPIKPVDGGKPADAGAVITDAGKLADGSAAPTPTPTFTVPPLPNFDASSLIPPNFDAGGWKPPWQK